MKLARILCEGVGSWLHFEYSCDRSGLFNEKYLSFPIGQILSSRFPNRVLSEFDHPILAPIMSGPGRRPQVDFVYCEPYPTIRMAVETKWIGKTKVTVEDVLWDLIRLEMIAAEHNAECIFILGGQRGKLESFFRTQKFLGAPSAFGNKPILNHKNVVQNIFPLVPSIPQRIPMLRKFFRTVPDIDYPQRLLTVRTDPFPSNPTLNSYQICAWRVLPMPNREVFRPSNSRRYC